jgi:effector-binding domain-containing protein
VQPADAFGEEIQVTPKTIIFFKGTANWDSAYDTLIDSFKSVQGFLDKENIKAAGPPMTIYISTDDTGFEFRAAIPIAEPLASPPRGDIEMGESPSGKMLKFVHRGSYDAMDTTYEAITNYLDTKQLEAQDTFIEEYVTDPLKTSEDQLVINVLVPIK